MKSRDWGQLHIHLWSVELDWEDNEMYRMPDYSRNARGIYVKYVPVKNDYVRVLYVGKGYIKQRCVNIHQGVDSRFTKAVRHLEFDKYDLRVAWAEVGDEMTRRGAEAYLAMQLQPVAGAVWHNDYPIAVNLPKSKGYRTANESPGWGQPGLRRV